MLKRMKLFTLFMFALVTCSATSGYSQEPLVSLDLKRSDVGMLFREIRRQTGLRFVYNEQHARSLPRFDLKRENASVDAVLYDVFGSSDLQWHREEDVILVTPRPQVRPQVNAVSLERIVGQVCDEHGNSLPRVTILVAGTRTGFVTDVDGNFQFRIPVRDTVTLIFSFVGMETQRVLLKALKEGETRPALSIVMREEQVELADVVVTGIFTKARESYTGAATRVTGKELKTYRGQNLLSTLRNIDPSINIIVDNNLGSNPNLVPEITIRGNSSLPMNVEELNSDASKHLNAPLVIMDGFEISISRLMDFNDEEIESITILKDASATAIYGSRGANGVIVLTTKSPQAGKLRVFVQGGVNVEIPGSLLLQLVECAGEIRGRTDIQTIRVLHVE
jgi:TonB-dependent SusC/RagA subfamily outer membrane receptor